MPFFLLALLRERLTRTELVGTIIAIGGVFMLVPTIIGHSILNYSMKHLRGQVVSILNVLQFVSAGIMAYFIRDEVPAATLYPPARWCWPGQSSCCDTGNRSSRPTNPGLIQPGHFGILKGMGTR